MLTVIAVLLNLFIKNFWLKYGRNNSQNLSKKQKYFTIMDFLKLSGVI